MKYINIIHLLNSKLDFTFKTIITLMGIIFLLGLFSIKEQIISYNITSDKITAGFRIILITDLHSCRYGKNMSALINEIKSQNPDAVLLGGDIYNDRKSDNSNTETFLKQIGSIYKCYFVCGNHDTKTASLKNIREIKKHIRNYGITVLDGIYDILDINGQKINICGVDDPNIAGRTFNRQLKNTASACNNNNYSILLSHRPELIDKYLKYSFDLVLSGHAHGGQWRIPKIVNGIFAPHQGFFPKYAGGKYDFGNTSLIVSRGLARESTPVPRIFNNPEIVVINVSPQ